MATEAQLILEAVAKNFDGLRRDLERLQEEVRQTSQLSESQEIRINLEIEEALKNLERVQKEIESVDDETREDRKLEFEVEVERALREVKKLGASTRKELDGLRREAKRNPFDPLSDSMARENRELLREFNRLDKNFNQALARLKKEEERAFRFGRARGNLQKLREEVVLSGQKITEFANRIPPAMQRAGTGFDKVRAASERASAAVGRFSAQAKAGDFNALAGNLTKLTNVVRLFLASLVIQRIVDFGRAIVQISTEVDALKRTLSAFRGVGGATEELARLEKLSNDLGASFANTRELAVRFNIVAEQLGFTQQDAADSFTAILVAAQALGGGMEVTTRIARAFTDVLGKGKLQAEELRRQLGQTGISVGLIARAIGKTTEELDKLLEQGKLSADQLRAVAAEMIKTFGPAALRNLESARAEFARMRNLFDRLARIAGEEILPVIVDLTKKIIQLGQDGTDSFRKFSAEVANLIENTSEGISRATERFEALTSLDLVGFIRGMAADVSELLAEMADSPELKEKLTELKDAFNIMANGAEAELERIGFSAENNAEAMADAFDAAEERLRSGAAASREAYENSFEGIAEAAEEAFGRVKDAIKRGETKEEAAELFRAAEEQLQRLREAAEKLREEGFVTDEQLDLIKNLGSEFDNLTKKAEENAEKLKRKAEELREAFSGLAGSLSGADKDTSVSAEVSVSADVSGLKAFNDALRSVKKTLEELTAERDSLAFSRIISEDDIKRVRRLDEEIARHRASLQEFGSAQGEVVTAAELSAIRMEELREKYSQAGASAKEAFERMRLGAEESSLRVKRGVEEQTEVLQALGGIIDQLKPVWDSLTEKQQQAVQLQVEALARLAEQGGVTEARLLGFAQQVGEAVPQAADAIAAAFEGGGGAAAELRQKLDELGGGLTDAAEKTRPAKDQIIEFTSASEILGNKAKEVGDGVNLFAGATEEAGEKAEEAASSLRAGSTASEIFAEDARKAAEGLQETGAAADEAAGPLDDAAKGVERLADGAERLNVSGSIFETIPDALAGFGEAAEPVGEVAAKADELATALEKTSATAPTATEQVQAFLDKMGEAQQSESLPEFTESIGGLGENLGEAKTQVEELNTEIQSFVDSGDAGAETAKKVKDAVGDLAGEETQRDLGEFSESLGKVEESLRGIDSKIEPFLEKTQLLETSLEEIEKAAGKVAERIDDDLIPGLDSVEPKLGAVAEKVTELAEQLGIAVNEMLRLGPNGDAFGAILALRDQLQGATQDAQGLAGALGNAAAQAAAVELP